MKREECRLKRRRRVGCCAVVEDSFSLSTCSGKISFPTATIVDKNNGQEINAVMFRPKAKLRVTQWIIGTGRVDSDGLSVKHDAACTHLTARFFANSQAFLKAYFIYILVLNVHVSFLFQNSTLLSRQNRIFVDMPYFLKIAILSPLLLTTALVGWRGEEEGKCRVRRKRGGEQEENARKGGGGEGGGGGGEVAEDWLRK